VIAGQDHRVDRRHCEQDRQHRDAEQEPRSQLAAVLCRGEVLVVSDGSYHERFHPDRALARYAPGA
jgi:hypothetical protein